MAIMRASIVGPFPPPVHGAAEVTRWVAEKLEAVIKVERLPISPAEGCKGVRYHLSRMTRVVSAACALVAGRGPVYLSAAGGFGLGYNVCLAATAHLLRRSVFIHHHSFSYIDRTNWLAALLIRAAGSSAVHVCLCARMAVMLVERYGPVRTMVLSNAAYYRSSDKPLPITSKQPIRIGHLGNLSIEKGLDVVVGLAEFLIQSGVSVQLMLAGPAANQRAAMLRHEARKRLGSSLTEFGGLYGAEKEQFFDSLDLFIFPTRYINEAEPLVVFEALSHGLPVIAFDRGCIAEQVGDAGLVVKPGADFVECAAALITAWSSDREAHAAMRTCAYERFRRLHNHAESQFAELLERLCAATL